MIRRMIITSARSDVIGSFWWICVIALRAFCDQRAKIS
jgi:hypothetical protein